jgi:hypothetical protein
VAVVNEKVVTVDTHTHTCTRTHSRCVANPCVNIARPALCLLKNIAFVFIAWLKSSQRLCYAQYCHINEQSTRRELKWAHWVIFVVDVTKLIERSFR